MKRLRKIVQQTVVYELSEYWVPGGVVLGEGVWGCNAGGNQAPFWALIGRLVSYDQQGIACGMQATIQHSRSLT